jgi:hypothetical protein
MNELPTDTAAGAILFAVVVIIATAVMLLA